MDALPNRSSRRRRRKRSNKQQEAVAIEPVLIAARRPGSPRIEKPTRRMKAASAKPRPVRTVAPEAPKSGVQASEEPARRREARIVQAKVSEVDDREKERRKLLAHVMNAEGRSAISRAAENYFAAGFELPAEQEAQLKLLEHFDESRARAAIEVLSRLLQTERPRQVPLFDQRLRRLEDHADEASTRDAAAVLRRALRA